MQLNKFINIVSRRDFKKLGAYGLVARTLAHSCYWCGSDPIRVEIFILADFGANLQFLVKFCQNLGFFGEKWIILVKKLKILVKNHNGGQLGFKKIFKNISQNQKS
jgi:hypothetical protein